MYAQWGDELSACVDAAHATIRVVCPFVKRRTAECLLERGGPKNLLIVTRLNLNDFGNGVSDTGALRLTDHGARVRAVKHLRPKLYLVGGKRAIVSPPT